MDEQVLKEWKAHFDGKSIAEAKDYASRLGNAEEAHAFKQWIAKREDLDEKAREVRDVELRLAEIGVANRAATAAEKSARWAGFAVFVSLAALLISAWPYIPR